MARTTHREIEPPRPHCGTCGHPEATHFFSVAVEELRLDRGPGVHAAKFWTRRYGEGTRIEMYMCATCMVQRIRVSCDADVSVHKPAADVFLREKA